VERGELTALGDVRTPTVADLFVALVGPLVDQPTGSSR
jgi:hypothetical protein